MNRLKAAHLALLDQAVISGSNFLSIILLARQLDPAGFGAFTAAHTGLLLAVSVQAALITKPHNVLGSSLAEVEYAPLTASLAAVQLAASTLLALLLLVVGAVMLLLRTSGAQIVLFLGLALAPWLAQEFVRRVHYTRGAVRAALANDVLCYGLQAGGVGILYATGAATSLRALGVFGASSFVAAAAGAWTLRDVLIPESLQSLRAVFKGYWAKAWGMGKWLTAQTVLMWFGTTGHMWVIGIVLGPAALGAYRAATHLAQALNLVNQTAWSYLPARASQAFESGGATGLRIWTKGIYLTTLPPLILISAGIVIFSQVMLDILYVGRFDEYSIVTVLVIAVVSFLPMFARGPIQVAILASRNTRPLFSLSVVAVCLMLTVGVWMTKQYGIVGAASAQLVINLVLLFVSVRMYRIIVR